MANIGCYCEDEWGSIRTTVVETKKYIETTKNEAKLQLAHDHTIPGFASEAPVDCNLFDKMPGQFAKTHNTQIIWEYTSLIKYSFSLYENVQKEAQIRHKGLTRCLDELQKPHKTQTKH